MKNIDLVAAKAKYRKLVSNFEEADKEVNLPGKDEIMNQIATDKQGVGLLTIQDTTRKAKETYEKEKEGILT